MILSHAPLGVALLIFFALGLGASLFLGPIFIPLLKKMKMGQAIREDGPQSHLQKGGTPTIGGLIFLAAFAFTMAVMLMGDVQSFYIIMGCFGFGLIGFLDDYLKVVRKHNLGLKAKQKLLLQLVVSIMMAIFAYTMGDAIRIPFMNGDLSLGVFFIPFIIFFILAVDNAVNLTDGLDGLAASITATVLAIFSILAFMQANYIVMALCLTMVGGLIGYLKFNWYPAKVFMGDTGSLALGGFVAAVAILLKLELWILVVGFIYTIEALSVSLQVLYYKKTKKRLFKMAPIHHHFELSGWKETKVVTSFIVVTLIGGIIGILMY